ncbi:1-(5-phosphoribosyl)-5-[(5-phosphoribosylamino)methylideneamino] imidazole-4-carboxamide isomerase [Alphaproteobacteria bacterium]|nr:1-(5-phosphoribosyl)-5-[(5-phosphoribosylamino)methylideneamino] imidazole-4-carboxamide isomerase [Alphaproteobacteria bacterium]
MKIFPAIDISEGKCIRLTKGLIDNKSIYASSPIEMAKEYKKEGFENIHLVDIDSTLSRGNNYEIIKEIRKKIDLHLQVAGGIRDEKSIKQKITDGFDRLVIGTLAIKNPAFIEKLNEEEIYKISIALDLKDELLASHGWKQTSPMSLEEITNIYNLKNIHSYFVTDISKDGMLSGLNLEAFKKIKSLSAKPVTIGGGVKNMEDIKQANNNNYGGVVVGKAIYENHINLKDLSEYQKKC